MLVISRRPREITAPIDENIIVAERHVARGRWTTAELPFTIVRRRRVQRGVQHYDTTVADLRFLPFLLNDESIVLDIIGHLLPVTEIEHHGVVLLVPRFRLP